MKLPRDASGFQVAAVLRRVGFEIQRQTGSHLILRRNGQSVSVPMHRTVKAGTLRKILRLAGLSPEEFEALLR